DVDHDVAVVLHDPAARLVALDAAALVALGPHGVINLFDDRMDLPATRSRRQHEEVVDGGHPPHVEDDDISRFVVLGKASTHERTSLGHLRARGRLTSHGCEFQWTSSRRRHARNGRSTPRAGPRRPSTAKSPWNSPPGWIEPQPRYNTCEASPRKRAGKSGGRCWPVGPNLAAQSIFRRAKPIVKRTVAFMGGTLPSRAGTRGTRQAPGGSGYSPLFPLP